MIKVEIKKVGSGYNIEYTNRDENETQSIFVEDSFAFEYFSNKLSEFIRLGFRDILVREIERISQHRKKIFTGLYIGGSHDGQKIEEYSSRLKQEEKYIVPHLSDWKAITTLDNQNQIDETVEFRTEKYKKMRIVSEDTEFILEIENSMTEKQAIQKLIDNYRGARDDHKNF